MQQIPTASSAAARGASSSGRPGPASARSASPGCSRRPVPRRAPSAEGEGEVRQPDGAKKPMFAAKAKTVIFLFMYGGPSQVDTFDDKPEARQARREDDHRQDVRPRRAQEPGPRRRAEVRSSRTTASAASCVCDLFPQRRPVRRRHRVPALDVRRVARSTARPCSMMNSGRLLSGSPCLGSWVTYGLGSENENLPGLRGDARPQPAGRSTGRRTGRAATCRRRTRACMLRADKTPIHDLALPPGTTRRAQRELLDHLKDKNEQHLASRADNTRAGRPHRQLRAGVQDAAARPGGGRLHEGDEGDAGPLRHRRQEDRRLRPEVFCWPRRLVGARRAVHSGLLRRQPQRRQLGRARRPGEEPLTARRRRPTSRSPALLTDLKQARPARQHDCDLGRRVRPPADGRVRAGHRPRPQRLRLHDPGWPAAASRAARASARPTNSATSPSRTAST